MHYVAPFLHVVGLVLTDVVLVRWRGYVRAALEHPDTERDSSQPRGQTAAGAPDCSGIA